MMTERGTTLERPAPHEILAMGREQIDLIDERLAELYALRMRTAYELKLARQLISEPVYNSKQQRETIKSFVARTEDGPVDRELALTIIRPLVTSEVTMAIEPQDVAIFAGREAEAPGMIDSCVTYIAELDAEIADLITARMLCAVDIGAAKRDMRMTVYRGERETEVIKRFVELCEAGNVPERLARDTIHALIKASRALQEVVVENNEVHIETELRDLTLQPEAVP